MATIYVDPADVGGDAQPSGRASSGSTVFVDPANVAAAPAAAPVVPAAPGGAAPGGALRGLMLGARNVGPYAASTAAGVAMGAPFGPPGMALGAVAGPTALGITDLATTGYNAIGPRFGLPRLQSPTETIDTVFDRLGFPRPESTSEKIVSNVTRAVGPAAASARTAQVLSQAPAAVATPANVGRNLLAQLGQNPGTQMAAAAGGAAAPTAAQEIFDIRNPLALMGIGAGGAMLAGGTASRFANVVSGGNYADPQTGRLVEEARARGVNLTPADVAPQGAGRVQRVARTVGLNAEDRATERAGQVTSLIERNVDAARPPSVQATGSADRAVASDLRQQYTTAKNTARQLYDAVDTAIAAQPGTGTMSPATTQQVAVQLRQQFPEWATLTNASRSTSQRLEGIVQGTGPRQSTIMGPNGQPMQLPGQASFADMRKLSTEVGQLVDATRTDPKLAAVHGQLKQLYGAIQQDVDNWAQNTTNRAAADAYGQAQNFFRNNVAPFRQDPAIYRAVSSRTPRADFDKEAQKITERLLGAGNETAGLAVNLMSPEGRQAYLERVHGEHESIYNAIRNHDTEQARAAMRTHLSNSRDRLRKARDGAA